MSATAAAAKNLRPVREWSRLPAVPPGRLADELGPSGMEPAAVLTVEDIGGDLQGEPQSLRSMVFVLSTSLWESGAPAAWK